MNRDVHIRCRSSGFTRTVPSPGSGVRPPGAGKVAIAVSPVSSMRMRTEVSEPAGTTSPRSTVNGPTPREEAAAVLTVTHHWLFDGDSEEQMGDVGVGCTQARLRPCGTAR